jgi:hypothetical protein
MPSKDFHEEDLKSFEDSLGALRPSARRLDPAWGAMLAKEVELNALLRWQRPPAGTEPPPLFGAGHHRCTSSNGHWFVCVNCGCELPVGSRIGRWGWPVALSFMTSIAAMLLVLLLTHQQGQIAGPDGVDDQLVSASRSRPTPAPGELLGATNQSSSTAPRRETAGSGETGVWPRIVASKQPNGRQILSAGDMQRAVTSGSFFTPN